MSWFDTQNLAEVTDPRYPGERLVASGDNPLLAEQRERKREDMLQATEQQLTKVAAMVERGARRRRGLRGAAAIGERVGREVNRYHMAKHFSRPITDTSFSYARDAASIEREAARDGRYVLRTNVAKERLDTGEVVLAYQSLAQVEQGLRTFKRCPEPAEGLRGLEMRPILHYTEPRVRAHLLLCLLAYWVQRELQQAQAPLLFMDQAPPARPDPVAPAPRSEPASEFVTESLFGIVSTELQARILEISAGNRIKLSASQAGRTRPSARRTVCQSTASRPSWRPWAPW